MRGSGKSMLGRSLHHTSAGKPPQKRRPRLGRGRRISLIGTYGLIWMKSSFVSVMDMGAPVMAWVKSSVRVTS